MFMKKIYIFVSIILCLTLPLQIIGCVQPPNDVTSTDDTLVFGNLPYNVCGDDGIAAYNNGWIYYRHFVDGEKSLWRQKSDGSASQKLIEEDVYYLNVRDQWIYCVSDYGRETFDNSLVRISLDGSIIEPVAEKNLYEIYDLILVDDWLYYRDFNRIVRTHITNGLHETLFRTTDCIYQMTISEDGWIYYYTYDNSTLSKMRLDGTEKQSVYVEKNRNDFTVADGTIYFYLFTDEYVGVCALEEAQTDFRQLTEQDCIHFKVVDDWLYYYCIDEQNIQRIRTNGTDHQVLIDHQAEMRFAIVDEWIYYYKLGESWEDSQMRKMALDGTNNQPMHS